MRPKSRVMESERLISEGGILEMSEARQTRNPAVASASDRILVAGEGPRGDSYQVVWNFVEKANAPVAVTLSLRFTNSAPELIINSDDLQNLELEYRESFSSGEWERYEVAPEIVDGRATVQLHDFGSSGSRYFRAVLRQP